MPIFRRALLLSALVCGITSAAQPVVDPLESASTGGIARLDPLLQRLAGHRRVLMIGAHPDDEDTRLLALAGRASGGEAAYLSLSRGEGGQNLIGPQLGVGLGLIRSRELLAARRIDGARQFFSRAFDFGYTRSLDETLARWPEEALVADAVAVIRRFKPQVIVAVFPADARAGHGQHQAAGLVAERAFAAAGDAAAYPEQGPPWSVGAWYRLAWTDPEAATLALPVGVLEPTTGRSVLQVALASRSEHRSQDMGMVQLLGDAETSLIRVAGGPTAATGAGLFAGINTRLEGIADLLPPGDLHSRLRARLATVAELVPAIRSRLAPAGLDRVVGPLIEIVRSLTEARDDLAAARPATPPQRQARELVAEKLVIAEEALATAAGIAVDAWTDTETVLPGGQLVAHAELWNAGPRGVDAIEIEVVSAAGWRSLGESAADPPRGFFVAQPTIHRLLDVAVPAEAPPTTPYFLRHPRVGDLYDWRDAPADGWGEPFEPPPLSLRFRFRLDGRLVTLEREVVARFGDQARGEIRRPLRVVPALEAAVKPSRVVWPLGRPSNTVEVAVVSHRAAPARVRVEVETPAGWPVVAPVELDIAADDRADVAVELVAPDDLEPGRYALPVTAVDVETGRRYAASFELLDFPHIRPTPMPVAATIEIHVGAIELPALERIGYVRGAADRVPEALAALGLPVELLTPAEIAATGPGGLAGYDVIVVGSRAFESDPALAAVNGRLLDYTRAGGLLIVQYQQYGFVRDALAPYPIDISRPHDRTTDEVSPVRLLDPNHPVFHHPNEIGPADWEGWVQERGLYFAGTWDDAYQPLLAMPDPEGVERSGALLVATLGRGHYVYTGLAFFRQLPAGVVGAYRLFANLLALGDRE